MRAQRRCNRGEGSPRPHRVCMRLGTEEEPRARMAAHAPIIDDSNKVVCDLRFEYTMARPNSDQCVVLYTSVNHILVSLHS